MFIEPVTIRLDYPEGYHASDDHVYNKAVELSCILVTHDLELIINEVIRDRTNNPTRLVVGEVCEKHVGKMLTNLPSIIDNYNEYDPDDEFVRTIVDLGFTIDQLTHIQVNQLHDDICEFLNSLYHVVSTNPKFISLIEHADMFIPMPLAVNDYIMITFV